MSPENDDVVARAPGAGPPAVGRAPRPATLVLSGGGAKGAFQVGAERVLREEHGYEWERIFGISVGALNATLLAQQQYGRLHRVWTTIREQDVYRKFSWPRVAWRLAVRRKLGAYDHRPLRALIERHAARRPFVVPAHVGRVSLLSGAYDLVDSDVPEAEFLDAVWQSATMPIIWEPIGDGAWVDGGLRNVTPLGDALDHHPSEVVVILCGAEELEPARRPRSIIDAATRSLIDITIHETMVNDVREFVRVNRLVQQAEAAGVTLTDDEGRPYRYVPITVIRPAEALGETLDFSAAAIEARLAAGETAARRVMADLVAGPG